MLACKISILKFSWAMKSHLLAFIFTKRGLIRKPNKSELTTELKSTIANNIPTHLPRIDDHRNLIVNFVAYTRKVSKKSKP